MTMKRVRRLSLMLSVSLAPLPALAEVDPGAYLAARAAGLSGDFAASAVWFTKALEAAPDNQALLANALTAFMGLGDFDSAFALADQIMNAGFNLQLANMVHAADAALRDDWDALIADLDNARSVGPLVDGLSRAWALVGKGQMTDALTAFDIVTEAQGLRAFGLYHKALALASVGDFEGADAILSMPRDQGFQRTRRAVMAHIEVLSQLDRNPDALALLDEAFGNDLDPGLSDLRNRLVAGTPIPFSFVTDARTGLAEVYFTVAGSLFGETDNTAVLMYAQTALAINPDHVDAMLIAAQALDRLGQFDLANATYARVPADNPAFYAAELGRADVLRRANAQEAAIEVLTQLARTHPDLPIIQAKLGDLYRRLDRMTEANTAYSRALDLFAQDDPTTWFVHYTRGITLHRLGDWDAAEADFRRALELNPGQAQVLNYLGYSMVERGENLDEALTMIRDAVIAEPQNGAIVDSLGWVYFRLGRYPEAVVQLERAAGLEPVDAEINDHLGDAYWAVGRKLEAQFQWHRALSLNPDSDKSDRIRRKIEVGLDTVLAEEGASPITVAQDGG